MPVEAVTHATVSRYIEHLMRKRLAPKTVNCHLNGIRQFYHYLREEEGVIITNPIRRTHIQKMSRPLPRHLRDEQVESLFKAVKGARDRAMFMLMLRCGLRVEEVAHLTIGVIDVNRRTILVEDGKGGKDRIVYMSHDALHALAAYLRVRPQSRTRKIFLAEKGHARGSPSPSAAFRSAWKIMPTKRSSGCPAIISGIRWPLRCSMPMPISAPFKIFWVIAM